MSSEDPELEWREKLADMVGFLPEVFNGMTSGEVVCKLFDECLCPSLSVGDDLVKLNIPDKYNIRVRHFK